MRRLQLPPAEIAASMVRRRGVGSVLEVGCGGGGILSQFAGVPIRVGVDFDEEELKKARGSYPGMEFYNVNITRLGEFFEDRLFDVVVASDVLEHFEKDVSWDVLRQMEEIATRFVVVWGPLGEEGMEDYNQSYEKDGSNLSHLCILKEGEFADRGYMTMVFPKYWQRYYRDVWTADGLLAIREI